MMAQQTGGGDLLHWRKSLWFCVILAFIESLSFKSAQYTAWKFKVYFESLVLCLPERRTKKTYTNAMLNSVVTLANISN